MKADSLIYDQILKNISSSNDNKSARATATPGMLRYPPMFKTFN